MGQEGSKKCPLSWSPAQNQRSGRRGNVVICIFKRQGFRLPDWDHSRIGFAGNDRHGAFMMVSRPRRADRACTLCPCPERPCCRHAAEQRDELAPLQLAARNLLLDRANAAIAASRIGSPAMGRWRLGGLGGGGCGGRPGGGVGGYGRTTRFRSQRRGCGLTHSETRRWPARPDLNRRKRSGRIPGSGQWQHGGRVI